MKRWNWKQLERTYCCLLLLATCAALQAADSGRPLPPLVTQERVFEWSFDSKKRYQDPFNDVEVDVVFTRDNQSWTVPAFWRGGSRWTIRFAPPSPGEYAYRVQSTDPSNVELNRIEGRVRISAYSGQNELLRRGPLRVSASRRYFEHTDGTPFYWLGDTWWTGLSERLSWEGFRKLTADRKKKGFTVIQIVAGLVPSEEELPPLDPGYRNEGGSVWEAQFARINPSYFDYADRRIQYLIDAGLVPVIFGAWNHVLETMGVAKMKQHWRYLIARYGAYPVFWSVGGEVGDPSDDAMRRADAHGALGFYQGLIVHGWTDVARYIRDTDPYHHPLTAHESPPPFDTPLQDEMLTDFDMFQSSHFGWQSIAAEVAQMNMHYARTSVTKPLVQGEIGYEKLGESFFEDFQRTAFWLSMLNGAAGHTYGANGTWEAYTSDKPFHRRRWSLLNWEEGMNLPGSYQVGLASKLLRQYPWWRFEPHPEWINPRGTTLLDPRDQINGFDVGSWDFAVLSPDEVSDMLEQEYGGGAAGEWAARQGNFRLPYAAGIPGEMRVIYMPNFGVIQRTPPTVLGLEIGVRYRAFLWEPTTGTRVDFGAVERPPPGEIEFSSSFDEADLGLWAELGSDAKQSADRGLITRDHDLTLLKKKISDANVVVAVSARSSSPVGFALRYKDASEYVGVIYSPDGRSMWIVDRRGGNDGRLLGKTVIANIGSKIRLSAEVRGNKAIASITDGQNTYTTPIVDVSNTTAGSVGLFHRKEDHAQNLGNFELRKSVVLVNDDQLSRGLYDAEGHHRGDLIGSGMLLGKGSIPGWSDFGRDKHILLDAYRPERLPTSGDWVLVLEKQAR